MFLQYLILSIYTLCLLLVFIISVGQAFLIYFYLKSKIKDTPVIDDTFLPKVTIQLPLYNELYVVERLIEAVCQINYPKEKLEIQLLDDSTDLSLATTQKLIINKQKEGFDIKHILREKNIGFKAGALQNGLKTASGEFIAIFDADFLPTPNFLQRLIPYFKNPKMGMVQSKWEHLNDSYSLLTKVQAFGLDGHFTVEQAGRNAAKLFINFNGTAGIWRKTCIEDAGGWQHDTLTEDLDLSYRAQLKGWEFKYVESFGTPAELPIELNAFKSQQHRWTKGAIETSKKIISNIWQSDISLKQKIFGSLHLLNSYSFLLVFLISILSIPVLLIKNIGTINPLYFQLMTFFVSGFIIISIFYTVAYSSNTKPLRSFWGLYPLFLSISMALSFHNSKAVLEGLFGFKSAFIRTPKFNIKNKEQFKNNIYRKKDLSRSFYIEVLLSLYFSFGVVLAFYFKDFGLLPFHLLLCMGFYILNFYSLKHLF